MMKKARIPNFFLVGAPKSGTTAMAKYLKQHYDIFIPEQKEPHYFSKDVITRVPDNEERYMDLFRGAKTEKRIGEASVWYLYSKIAAKNISNFNPNAKIIIMLRNPVEMLHSLHSQFLYTGNENIKVFRDAIDAEKDRRQGRRIPRFANFPSGLHYSQVVKYSEQIERYLKQFGQENVHIVLFDDFVQETPEEYRKVLEFLNVDSDFQANYEKVNSNKVVRLKSLLALQKFSSFLSSEIYKNMVVRPLGLGILKKLRKLNSKTQQRETMPREIRAMLTRKFSPEIRKTARLIKRDLDNWL